jgi:hypothetical protein
LCRTLDRELVEHADLKRTSGIWQAISSALVALARKSGATLHHSPLPEIREAARDWQG